MNSPLPVIPNNFAPAHSRTTTPSSATQQRHTQRNLPTAAVPKFVPRYRHRAATSLGDGGRRSRVAMILSTTCFISGSMWHLLAPAPNRTTANLQDPTFAHNNAVLQRLNWRSDLWQRGSTAVRVPAYPAATPINMFQIRYRHNFLYALLIAITAANQAVYFLFSCTRTSFEQLARCTDAQAHRFAASDFCKVT